MARTLKELDTFANALKKRMDDHDALHVARPLHSHGSVPPPTPPPGPPPGPVKQTLSPDEGPAGTRVTVGLTGFAPGSAGMIMCEGIILAPYIIDANGALSGVVTVPALVPGNHQIAARGLDGVTVTSRTFVLTGAAPAPTPTPPPTPTPTPTPGTVLVILGYGAHALDGLGGADTVVKNTAEFLAAYKNLGGSLNVLRFPAGLKATIDLGDSIKRLDGRSGLLIDGRGADISFVGAPIWFEGCHHYAVVNVRHRGGWAAGQDGDNFTNAGGNQHYAYVNVSASNFSDEGLSSTRDCDYVTYQDVVIGKGLDPAHSYGSLNAVGHLSVIRNTYIGLEYRNPQIASGEADVVNAVRVDCKYGISIHGSAHANDTAPYNQGVTSPIDKASGATLGGLSVPAYAKVVAMSPGDAARYAKVNGGCLPHDSFDSAQLARITA